MSRTVFSTEARADLRDAHAHYAAIDARLAQRFSLAVEHGVGRMSASPKRWPEVAAGVRRCLLDSFSYSLVYRVQGPTLRVIALLHHRRQPRDWAGDH